MSSFAFSSSLRTLIRSLQLVPPMYVPNKPSALPTGSVGRKVVTDVSRTVDFFVFVE